MKKRMCATLLLAAAMLSGCGNTQQSPTADAAGADGPSESAAVSAMKEPSAAQSAAQSLLQEEATPSQEPTEEEILTAYDRAVTAYEWFDLNTLPCEGPVEIVDGVDYQRVEAGFETLADLEVYLRGIFSSEVIDRLLQKDAPAPLYRDLDGILYVHSAGRGADIQKGGVTAAVQRQDSTHYLVNVTAELLADDLTTVTGVECCAFPYEWVGDRWVFTDFALVY